MGGAGRLPEQIFENFVVVGPTVDSSAPQLLYNFPPRHDPAVQELVAFCCPHDSASDSAGEAAALASAEAWHSYVAAPALEGSESWMFSLRGAAMLRPLYGICVSVIAPLDAALSFSSSPPGPTAASGSPGPHSSSSGAVGLGRRCYCFLSLQPHFDFLRAVLRRVAAREKALWLAADNPLLRLAVTASAPWNGGGGGAGSHGAADVSSGGVARPPTGSQAAREERGRGREEALSPTVSPQHSSSLHTSGDGGGLQLPEGLPPSPVRRGKRRQQPRSRGQLHSASSSPEPELEPQPEPDFEVEAGSRGAGGAASAREQLAAITPGVARFFCETPDTEPEPQPEPQLEPEPEPEPEPEEIEPEPETATEVCLICSPSALKAAMKFACV